MNSTMRIAQLLRVVGKVDGRKKLHKEVHILQELGCPFQERFEYSYYGMYSPELRQEVDSLIKDKLLREQAMPNYANEVTYSVESTPQLANFLDQLSNLEKEPLWSSLAKRLNTLSPRMLEGISTILFLCRRGLQGEELKNRFEALKPHLASIYAKCENEAKNLKASQSQPVAA